MAKTFLDHLIVLEEVTSELDVYDLPADEREEILGLIHHTTHQHLLNVILNHLPKEHHEPFLTKFQKAPHDPELLAFLKKEIKADIESEIRIQAKKIKAEILAEIKKSKR
ncbi:MAG: hypothetical protein UX80_C0004G0036 [Candidatus Amesbacteria bacterium GW2011_GWA2_47_11b]|uniref:Uncharacterized protein n=3 Tax=Candidatus Amesiibacteriota TaxID=1752730 RepID=A0A0G1USB0_9BACT|nr:MAG: hypothetical protein UX42_C0001G0012 [Microgenomates group bacterium GW2011_GWC1_46_20]KKU58285.1 MAG: hypothetical protein UX80_C0004G0036 [Candidatus Amesbacteria bacterium GW2011_GWA2_47_11b]KKU68923.1 MAG: hypothetical protein UX92_C0017G0030 [Candidatus Amesbacteria bacterium GW2011_GWA1_47_20]